MYVAHRSLLRDSTLPAASRRPRGHGTRNTVAVAQITGPTSSVGAFAQHRHRAEHAARHVHHSQQSRPAVRDAKSEPTERPDRLRLLSSSSKVGVLPNLIVARVADNAPVVDEALAVQKLADLLKAGLALRMHHKKHSSATNLRRGRIHAQPCACGMRAGG